MPLSKPRTGVASIAAMRVLGAWLLLALMLHLAWEIAHLPFYTLWAEGAPAEIAWAVLHCTVGDGLIALGAYGVATAATRTVAWPWRDPRRGLAVLWAAGLGWTAFSEWRHVQLLGSWAYSDAMPTLAGVGFTPLAQWIVVPALAVWCLRNCPLDR